MTIDKRSLRRLLPYGFVVVVAVVLVIRAESQNAAINNHFTREVQRVEGPCLQHGPKSPACHKSFGAALEALNEVLTPQEARIIVCRSNLFVDLPACQRVHRQQAAAANPNELQTNPNLGVAAGGEEAQAGAPTATAPAYHNPGGVSPGSSHPHHQAPPATHGNPPSEQGGNGGPGASNPSPSPPAAEQAAAQEPGSSESSGGGSGSEASGGQSTHLVPEVVEGVEETLGKAGEVVEGVLEGTGNAGCMLLETC